MPTEYSQKPLVTGPEFPRAPTLEIQHPRELTMHNQRHSRRALHAIQARQRDLRARGLSAAALQALRDRRLHRTPASHVGHANHPAPLRSSPDHPDPNRHLSPSSRNRIPVARDREHPVTTLIGHQQDRLGKPEQVIERLKPGARRLRIVDAKRDAPHKLIEQRHRTRSSPRPSGAAGAVSPNGTQRSTR